MGGEETEFHQRQPLLGDEGGTGGECRPSRFHNPASSFNQQGIFSPRRARNGSAIQIEIELPPVERSSSETKFPIERWKTFVALLFVLINFILTTTSLSITHELRRPQSKPLPDITLDSLPYHAWALDISEVNMITTLKFYSSNQSERAQYSFYL